MEKILISGCLFGQAVRYDGKDNRISHPLLEKWQQEGRLVVLCPEVAGGLPTPRPPAEIQPDGRIVTIDGQDVSVPFEAGAQQALSLCQRYQIKLALLKERSPSCGSHQIYDGQFKGQLIAGQGRVAKALTAAGIQVFSEAEIEALADALADLKP